MVEVAPNSLESVLNSIHKFGADQAALKYATVAVRLVTDKLEDPIYEQDKSQQYLVNSNGFSTMPAYKENGQDSVQDPEQTLVVPVNTGQIV